VATDMKTTRATSEGTDRYARRMAESGRAVPSHFKRAGDITVSSIGLGTYLGDADDPTDVLYAEAVAEAVALGCNVIDTAINYRFQRSERSIGAALAKLFTTDVIRRDEVMVSTKGGYVPFDGEPPQSASDVRAYLETTFFEPGVCTPGEMAARGQHCMAPRYLAHQLDRSLANLALDAVDVYYIHNPEGQLPEVGRAEFDRRIRAAFELLESKAADGKIGSYGTATWSGFRAEPNRSEYLSLATLERLAREVGGPDHHFRVVQLPYSLAMPEAYAFANQLSGTDHTSMLEAAADLGIAVYCSGTLMQSRLAGTAPVDVGAALGFTDGALCAIQFSRSTPGVASSLVGMKRVAHVRSNLALATVEPGSAESVESLFEEG
jgi:aryl-alcohol dehydrogenase-like predicted oxidoreductase